MVPVRAMRRRLLRVQEQEQGQGRPLPPTQGPLERPCRSPTRSILVFSLTHHPLLHHLSAAPVSLTRSIQQTSSSPLLPMERGLGEDMEAMDGASAGAMAGAMWVAWTAIG